MTRHSGDIRRNAVAHAHRREAMLAGDARIPERHRTGGRCPLDADTLVQHRLTVVTICGENGVWGLEKHPMRSLCGSGVYGSDVAANLRAQCPHAFAIATEVRVVRSWNTTGV